MALDACFECLIAKWRAVPTGKDERRSREVHVPSPQPQFARELAELRGGGDKRSSVFSDEHLGARCSAQEVLHGSHVRIELEDADDVGIVLS
jgi:hypothetical protein